ncbi:hypothetical protein [Streptomyces atratus]
MTTSSADFQPVPVRVALPDSRAFSGQCRPWCGAADRKSRSPVR